MKICLEHVTKTYGELVVFNDLTLTVEEGEAIVLTGPSGSGKTTLLRLILGLEKPDHGQIRIRGLHGSAEVRRPLAAGCVFQEDRLLRDCSAVENLKAAPGGEEAKLRAALEELLPADALNKPVHELSGGMRRRVCLARACLSGADVMILDEPFTGLDEAARQEAVRFLQEHRRGRTLVLAAHSLSGLSFCRRVDLETYNKKNTV